MSQSTQCKRKPMKPRSVVWEHFTKIDDKSEGEKERCNYCSKLFCCDPIKNGTSGLKNHLNSCPKFPKNIDDSQKELSLQPIGHDDKTGNLSTWKFDKNIIRGAIAEMIIVDELPFKFIESKGFQKLLHVACPKFKIPSRWTVSRDCIEIYEKEKIKLKAFLKTNTQKVCITTDTWTSLQRVNYMCITVHFIDHEWKLHKKILNFTPIFSHKGDSIGRLLIACLLEWGIKNVFTITVDNASSNDVAVAYIKKTFNSWENGVANHTYLHMRCIAHIINLVVQDGLKEVNSSVTWLRKAIKYIRLLPARLQKWTNCVKETGISAKHSLCLDVVTRWNSTYKMLNVAEKFEAAFDLYDMQDPSFKHDIENYSDGGFFYIDWSSIRKMSNMLQHFYDTTVRISGSYYVTSNIFWTEINDLLAMILKWTESNDLETKTIGIRMKTKFDKYWCDHNKMNKLIFIATILDPREKFDIMEFAFSKLYGVENGIILLKGVKDTLFNLFDEYKRVVMPDSDNGRSNMVDMSNDSLCSTSLGQRKCRQLFKEEYLKQKMTIEGACDRKKTELDTYLNEATIEDFDDFDILRWWRLNSERFPILSSMAKDILAVPISTVASEAVFSTRGRVLDSFRSSLTSHMAECLICAQDWLREGIVMNNEEDLEEVETFESNLVGVELYGDIEMEGNISLTED